MLQRTQARSVARVGALLLAPVSPQRIASASWNPSDLREGLESVAKRLPQHGMSAAQLQALLDDEYPLLGQSLARQSSLHTALCSHPDLFAIGPTAKGMWVTRPAGPSLAAARDGGDQMEAALRTVEQYCAKTLQQRGEGVKGSAASFLPLEHVLAACKNVDVDVVDAIARGESPLLETKIALSVKPRRTPRAAHLFVDGDELPAVAVDEMCTQLALIKEECNVCIVRRQGSASLSAVDVVAPDVVPTYLCVEKKARELRYRCPVVLRDVVYMCSGRQFATYADHVAKLNAFPDADVYVCCPSRIELVQKKLLVPFVE